METPILKPLELEKTEADVINNFGSRVILFNDDVHTFEEVANQLVKAIECSLEHATKLTNEVHTKGKAAVFEGEMVDCIRVSFVLEEISLHTQIEC